MNLAQRAAATKRTYDKFRGRRFDWNGCTCAHLLRAHLRHCDYKPPKMPPFRSAVGAKRALREFGADDLVGLLRKLNLIEIAAAEAIVGDVAVLPGDNGPFDAIVVNAGGKWAGWHPLAEGLQPMVVNISAIKAVFRP